MNVFPNGFLSELYCLRAVPSWIFAELQTEEDFNDADNGEILITPELLSEISGEQCTETTSAFLGTDSMGGTTLARVEKMAGPEALAKYFEALKAHAKPSQADAASLLPRVIELSARLQNHREGEIVRVKAQDGTFNLQPLATN